MKTTRVLLCDRRTGAYLLSPDAWTAQIESAHDFVRVADALRFAYQWALNGVEVVLAFEQPEYNVRVPVEGPISLG